MILAGLLAVFRGALLKGLVFQEPDTLSYYYPALTELRRALQQGSLPIWTPNIYGGFPLFADGESGALYPVNVLLLLLMPADGALVWLGPIRLAMAAVFMYLYARTIDLGRLGALVSALVFGFGGFTVAQLHHVNLSNGALWLPLILLFVERAYRREGRARLQAVLLAGIVFAVQALALHVQVSLMTGLFLVAYLAFRSLAFPVGTLLRRVRLGLATLAGTAGLGLGLAAVQWVPLYELSRFSPRAPGLLYSQALEYALPPINLITLLAPYFFRTPQRVWWPVWSPWETTIYVGVAPLLLAGVAVLWVRSRWTAFFAGTALLSLLLAMGNYLPLNLYYLLYRLPWFDSLRGPGRFSYLFTFSMACLAGYGAHWLARHREAGKPARFRLLPLGFVGLLGVLLVSLQWFQAWLSANRDFAVEAIGGFYLSLGPSSLSHLNQWDVYDFLRSSTGLLTWAAPSGWVLASCVLLVAWGWLPHWRKACLVGLVLLVAADLFWFDQIYHETIPADKLTQQTPAVDFLAQQNGSDRVFGVGSIVAEPNRLAPFGLQAAGGYSSLPFQRHREYSTAALHLERPLMELWNVRYLVAGKRPSYVYNGLSFDPATPLFSGGTGSFPQRYFNVSDIQAREVRLLSSMHRAADIPQGTPVGSLVLTDSTGSQSRIPLQAGVSTAEAAYDREDVRPVLRHQRPKVATSLKDTGPGGAAFSSNVYYASVILPQPMDIRRVSLEYTYPTGSLDVYSVAFVNGEDRIYEVRPFHLEKYRQVYTGDEGAIFENQAVLPRAFLAPRVTSLRNSGSVLARLSAPDFDPLSELLLEEQTDAPQGTQSRAQGAANIIDYQDRQVIVQTVNDEPAFLFLGDSYYPGWKAYVDGQQARLYRADYLFRAVPVPAGEHTVEFRYQPDSLTLGIGISAVAAGSVILAFLGSWIVARKRRAY